jgi:glycosyl transferase family 2
MPRFSVVVPTRDRPDLLDFCLEGIAGQTFADFEVIVSDNPLRSPARSVFDRWAGSDWRYLEPQSRLQMHDNFEVACDEASGDYVAVVIDKTVLHPSALEFTAKALEHEHSDIVTWWNEGYHPFDEALDPRPGRFLPAGSIVEPAAYDPGEELVRRFGNATRRGADPVHYFRGKIVFGAYSRRLLDRIREQVGRVFHPLAPDYTSMVPASVLARGALDLGRPLLVSYNSNRSNGRLQSIDPRHARRFIEGVDPAIVGALPIAGLYSSHHNVVAYDLASSAARCPPGSTPALDLVELLGRAREDLAEVEWPDPAERSQQYAILEMAEQRHGVDGEAKVRKRRRASRELVAQLLVRLPPVERLAYRAIGRMSPHYESPVQAARAADRFYAARSAT